MVKKQKKKSEGAPKVRRTWKINPKTRVKESDEIYNRAKEKLEDRRAIDEVIDFFGEA